VGHRVQERPVAAVRRAVVGVLAGLGRRSEMKGSIRSTKNNHEKLVGRFPDQFLVTTSHSSFGHRLFLSPSSVLKPRIITRNCSQGKKSQRRQISGHSFGHIWSQIISVSFFRPKASLHEARFASSSPKQRAFFPRGCVCSGNIPLSPLLRRHRRERGRAEEERLSHAGFTSFSRRRPWPTSLGSPDDGPSPAPSASAPDRASPCSSCAWPSASGRPRSSSWGRPVKGGRREMILDYVYKFI